tara:strand:- start:309 stop:419 length:111 start_codon:yes stop_codon:yes gene_type:complete
LNNLLGKKEGERVTYKCEGIINDVSMPNIKANNKGD